MKRPEVRVVALQPESLRPGTAKGGAASGKPRKTLGAIESDPSEWVFDGEAARGGG
jgi:hypothetical protein